MNIILLIIIILLVIVMLKENNYLKLVIYFTAFSLLMSLMYFIYNAYDVALAEIAIGSAILPLIFIISIEKQKQFVVISRVKDDYINEDLGSKGQLFLNTFSKRYGLKTKVYFEKRSSIKGAFRNKNADAMFLKSHKDDKYIILLKKTSIINSKMKRMTEENNDIRLELVEEDNIYD